MPFPKVPHFRDPSPVGERLHKDVVIVALTTTI